MQLYTGEDLDQSGDGVVPKQHVNKRRPLTETEIAENKKYAPLIMALRNSNHAFAGIDTPSQIGHKARVEKVESDPDFKEDRAKEHRLNDNKASHWVSYAPEQIISSTNLE
ncbi:unnamed protein product [Sympodiomycopsis kandeliae]